MQELSTLAELNALNQLEKVFTKIDEVGPDAEESQAHDSGAKKKEIAFKLIDPTVSSEGMDREVSKKSHQEEYFVLSKGNAQ